MHINHRIVGGWVGLAAALSSSGAATACQDIAVLSTDARFVVLSGDTLEERDVGNLWWLGIRGVDFVIPGSTLARVGILSDTRVDPATGTRLNQQTVLMVIPDLARDIESPRDVAVLADSGLAKAWWVDETPRRRLIAIHRNDERAAIGIYDSELNRLSEWPASLPGLALGVSCADGERLIMGALDKRLVAMGDAAPEVSPLVETEGTAGYRMTDVARGCWALMVKLNESGEGGDINSEQVTMGLIDLASNQVEAEFKAKRIARSILFAAGARLFQQDLVASPARDVGYSVAPTRHVRILDTQNGNVLRSAELSRPGEAARLICRGKEERVVVTGPHDLQLLDLNTLSVLASKRVPFESYFVF